MPVHRTFFSTFFVSEEDLITKVFQDFLSVYDFCYLNTSLCNRKNRDNALKCFKGHSFYGINSTPLGDSFLKWSRHLSVSFKYLNWNLDSLNSSSIFKDLCANRSSWDLTILQLGLSRELTYRGVAEGVGDLRDYHLTIITPSDVLFIVKHFPGLESLSLIELSWLKVNWLTMNIDLVESILHNCPKLQSLNLIGCPWVDLNAIHAVEKRFPDLKISHMGDSSGWAPYHLCNP
jgi:hypothetical protein